MATRSQVHPKNAAGPWFVDTTCIDCDVCREHVPEVFGQADGGTYVIRPPSNPDESRRAWLALQACPVACIGADEGKRPAEAQFPLHIDGDVWLCGMTLAETYGGQSYFIKRAGGNLLIDSPRPAAALHKWFAEQGGIADILLTHQDDVAKADETGRKFGARIWIHEADRVGFATDVWRGRDEVEVRPGVVMLPVPGHTEGSVVFLVDDAYLFSGDSLAWDEDTGKLYAFQDFCWWSWPKQLDSLERLAKRTFRWVLPGHGRRTPVAAEGLGEQLAKYVRSKRK
jgi:glyoxylase-like metal-dependent hydrolase (beta-lactamase superfamily II)/ferredoxin